MALQSTELMWRCPSGLGINSTTVTKSGTAEEWRGGPIATLTQVVTYDHTDGHVQKCWASLSYHAASVHPAVMGTWWNDKAKVMIGYSCSKVCKC